MQYTGNKYMSNGGLFLLHSSWHVTIDESKFGYETEVKPKMVVVINIYQLYSVSI